MLKVLPHKLHSIEKPLMISYSVPDKSFGFSIFESLVLFGAFAASWYCFKSLKDGKYEITHKDTGDAPLSMLYPDERGEFWILKDSRGRSHMQSIFQEQDSTKLNGTGYLAISAIAAGSFAVFITHFATAKSKKNIFIA